MSERYFYDLSDYNYYMMVVKSNKLSIYLLNTDTYEKTFMIDLEPIEIAQRMLDREIRKLDDGEEAKMRLLFRGSDETLGDI